MLVKIKAPTIITYTNINIAAIDYYKFILLLYRIYGVVIELFKKSLITKNNIEKYIETTR